MREYESTVIIQPEISDEGSQAIRDRLDATLEKYGAVRLMWSDLGKRKLAYEIRKFHKGHYYVLHYLDPGRVIPELERQMRIDESILRFMTIQVNDTVVDIEARKVEARELEAEQRRRAAEKAAREAEEAKARAEVERSAAEEAEMGAEDEVEADDMDEELEGEDLDEDEFDEDDVEDEDIFEEESAFGEALDDDEEARETKRGEDS